MKHHHTINARKITFITACFSVIIYGQNDMFNFGSNRPVADAGRDIKTVSEGSIFLDGSRSFVNDGSKIKYHWTFSPGLALTTDNDFSSEISFETYGEKFLKSVETYKNVLDVKLSGNTPGTKLEVILKIRDRIGFEDSDTLLVEYFDPTAKKAIIPDTLEYTDDKIDLEYDDTGPPINNENKTKILVQGLANNNLNKIDAQIINSIIMDHIKSVGFDYDIRLSKDMKKGDKNKKFRLNCKTDDCASYNAYLFNAKYVITWQFAIAADQLSIRIFQTENFNSWIDEATITNPYRIMNESGIYGIEPHLRGAISTIMGANNFKKDISNINRLLMKNNKWISYGKYPVVFGAAYLFFNSIFSEDPEEKKQDIPPGFPHE